MSSISIAGDTSGSVILQAPSIAGSTTLTLPSTSGTVVTSASSLTASQLPAGSVVQVVQSTYGTNVSTSSATLIPTGLTASITPSSSSNKILVCVSMAGCYKASNNTALWLAIYKNGSNIFNISDFIGYTNNTGTNAPGVTSSMYLDAPATTSSTTYAIYFASAGNSANVVVNNYYSIQAYTNSTLTLMEIKA
jgi:hypothetical protein